MTNMSKFLNKTFNGQRIEITITSEIDTSKTKTLEGDADYVWDLTIRYKGQLYSLKAWLDTHDGIFFGDYNPDLSEYSNQRETNEVNRAMEEAIAQVRQHSFIITTLGPDNQSFIKTSVANSDELILSLELIRRNFIRVPKKDQDSQLPGLNTVLRDRKRSTAQDKDLYESIKNLIATWLTYRIDELDKNCIDNIEMLLAKTEAEMISVDLTTENNPVKAKGRKRL